MPSPSIASSSAICAAAYAHRNPRVRGSVSIASTIGSGMRTMSTKWTRIAPAGSPASISARARATASVPIGNDVGIGGSYATIPANAAGSRTAASSPATAPEECPTRSTGPSSAAATASTSSASAATVWPGEVSAPGTYSLRRTLTTLKSAGERAGDGIP